MLAPSNLMHRVRSLLASVLFGILCSGVAAAAEPPRDLVAKLESSVDFRVRVQAALQLGKGSGRSTRIALEAALDDENAAVRAAAAAALKVFGDPEAIPALNRHAKDDSPAVRAQIQSTLSVLTALGAEHSGVSSKPEVVVQLGKIHAATTGASDDAERTSKLKLKELPGIAVVDEGKAPTPTKAVPVIMVTGRVKQLEPSRQGARLVYVASVEFVLHKMPGQAIKGVVSGSARASGDVQEMGDARAVADLRRSALEAAIDSAVRRAPQALRAAAE